MTALRTVLPAIAGVLALAPATWWVAGWFPTVDPDGADFLMVPVRLPPGAELVIGLASAAVVIAAVRSLRRSLSTSPHRRDWWMLLAATGGGAMYLGLAYRVSTNPVIGANIGGGLMIMAAVPVLSFLLGFSILRIWRLCRRGDAETAG